MWFSIAIILKNDLIWLENFFVIWSVIFPNYACLPTWSSSWPWRRPWHCRRWPSRSRWWRSCGPAPPQAPAASKEQKWQSHIDSVVAIFSCAPLQCVPSKFLPKVVPKQGSGSSSTPPYHAPESAESQEVLRDGRDCDLALATLLRLVSVVLEEGGGFASWRVCCPQSDLSPIRSVPNPQLDLSPIRSVLRQYHRPIAQSWRPVKQVVFDRNSLFSKVNR